jgi:divalent metal cation (Fe/Co/Zn/Cd) transporter
MTTASRAILLRRGLRLEYFTVAWNVVEGIIAVGAGVIAGSPALIGFGIDSAVESISGGILIWRLRAEQTGQFNRARVEAIEQRAERLVGVAFLVLAAYVAFESVRALVGQQAPEASVVGIALTATSLVVMLLLARAKTRTADDLHSHALAADARQTYACWYLTAVTHAGLGLNALFGWWWADPVAALGISAILVKEGIEAWQGGHDEDCPPEEVDG